MDREADGGSLKHPFAGLLIEAGRQAEAAGFAPLSLPPVYAHRRGKGGIELSSGWWRSTTGTELRTCYLSGPKLEIVVCMGYPVAAERVPVFGAELVVAAGQCRVAVVDLQPASGPGPQQATVTKVLAPLRDRFMLRLTDGGPLPEWATHHFTPACVYARPVSASEHAGLHEAFEAYFALWLETFAAADGPEFTGTEALTHYQNHHVAHTPGRPLIATTFGENWAEAYFSRFIYSSDNPQQDAATVGVSRLSDRP